MSDDANHTRSNAVMLSKLFWRGWSLAAFGTAYINILKVSFSSVFVLFKSLRPNTILPNPASRFFTI